MHPTNPPLPATLADYTDAVNAETVAPKDVGTGRGRFAAIVAGILADNADRGPDVRSDAVRTTAAIFMYAGWTPEFVVSFAADHAPDDAVADAWPHDPDCWCPICRFVDDPLTVAPDPAATCQGAGDILDRLHHAGIHGGYLLTPGPGTPHVPIPLGTVFLSDADGSAPHACSPSYTVGLTITHSATEEIVWQGTGYPTAVAVLIAVARAARALEYAAGGF